MAAAFVQETDTFHGSPSQTITATLTVTAGSSLLVFGLTDAAPTCSDGVNGSYGASAESVVDNIGLFNAAFCKDGCAAGSTTVTIDAGSGGNAYGIWVIEISGTSGLSGHAAHADSSAPGAGTDAISSGNGTPGAQPGIMVGFCACFFYGAGSEVAGTGFTSGALGWNGGGSSLGRSERKAYAALTAVPATFTAGAGGSGDIFSTFVAFFPDSGGGGGNTMTVAGTAPVATSAIALASTDSLAVAGTAPVATSSIALASTDSLTVAATVPVATAAIALGSTDVLTIAGVAPAATMAATLISPDRVVTVAATVPVATSATALASTDVLTVAGVAPVATSAIALASTDSLAIAATVPVSTMAATLTAGQNNVSVDATVPPPTCAAALASTDFLAVAATVPGATMAADLTAPYVIGIAAVVPVATMVAGLTIPVVYVDPGSPWARILKPRYARWRRRTNGIT